VPVTKNVIIQHFTDRFLNLEKGKQISSIAEILDLPVSSLKDTNARDIEVFASNHVKTIRDLSQLKPEIIEEISRNSNIDLGRIKKFHIASKLISRAWQKRASYAKKATMKIVVVGLDNAGKTTLIDLLSGKKLSDVINQTPTTMVNQVTLPSQDVNLVAWDFGGQIQHRAAYLQNPEEYFVGLDLVLFVIDMQDAARYEEAIGYFSQLLEIIMYLKENPYFLVLLHKSDPELLGDPDFQIHLEYIDGKIRDIMSKTRFGLEIIKSSIYSTFTPQPQIVNALKDMFKTNQVADVNVLILDAMMKLTDLVTQVGNKMVELQEKIQSQVQNLEMRFLSSEKGALAPVISSTSSLVSCRPGEPEKGGMESPTGSGTPGMGTTPSKIPRELPSINISNKNQPSHSEMMSELKEMFRKKGLTRDVD